MGLLLPFTTFVHCFQFLQNTDLIDWSQCWNPRLYIDNYQPPLCQSNETVSHSVLFNGRRESFVVERRLLKGATFVKNFELSQFPFDTQVTHHITDLADGIQFPQHRYVTF